MQFLAEHVLFICTLGASSRNKQMKQMFKVRFKSIYNPRKVFLQRVSGVEGSYEPLVLIPGFYRKRYRPEN